MTPGPHHDLPEIDQDKVAQELLATAYQALPMALLANLAGGLTVVFVLWQVAPEPLGWLVALLLALGLRSYQLFWYRGLPVPEAELARARRGLYLSSVLSGLVWGSAAVMLWPPGTVIHQSFLLIALAGITAGSLSTLASLRWGVPLFLAVTLLPFLDRFLTFPDSVALPLVLLWGLFALTISVTGRRTFRTLRLSFETRFARERAEALVERHAFYDELTSLPNRRLLMERLDEAILRARERGGAGAVLFIDLDGFKRINDSLGHHVGDQLLRAVAERLDECLRDTDTVARLGGDEFVVLLPDLGTDTEHAMQTAEDLAGKVRNVLSRPVLAGGHELHVTASIGVAVFPAAEDRAAEILKHADTAMYHVKKAGRDGVRAFARAMHETARRRMETEHDLRVALSREQFIVHYQPQVDGSGHLTGLEALVRWEKPGHGLVAPGVFIGVAEDTGLIFELHDQVMARVCGDLARLASRLEPDDMPRMSINLSPREFHRPGFTARLEKQIAQRNIEPHWLCLEITENAAMQRIDEVVRKMRSVRDLGIHFAIDDFGTGYSSLAYLKRLPLDMLKIDRSFVRDILTDGNDAVIVRAIVAMTDHLGIRAVAEGVETQQVADYLIQAGCQHFQGWLYGKAEPLPHYFPQMSDRPEKSEVS